MILVVPKKTLTASDKKQLLKKGYVVIECEKPESVRVISPEVLIDKSDLFLSALSAIVPTFATNSAEKFVFELHRRMMPPQKFIPKKKIAENKEKQQTVLKEPIKEYSKMPSSEQGSTSE